MKYVMFETENGRKFAVMFPDHMVHAQVAQMVGILSLRAHKEMATPVTAGFVNPGDELSVAGESESLKLKSDPVDAIRIMIGESVSSMPDSILAPLWKQVEDARRSVKVPESVEEAKGMMLVGEAWLKEHAPTELRPSTPDTAMAGILQRWRDGYAFNEDSAEDVALLERADRT